MPLPIAGAVVKGFPNQVAELSKIAVAIEQLVNLVDAGEDAKNDGVFGEALVRAGVAGTGHVPMPIEAYLRVQRTKPIGGQSFRTTARGLRELFRRMRFIDDSEEEVFVTNLGRQAARFSGRPMDAAQIAFWRRVIRNIVHDAGDTESHPYQVLLRLVARRPGITRAKCALALEAEDDSPEELDRIVALADLPEGEIRRRIHVSKSNWDNAKKVLPKFAQQLGDVVVRDGGFHIADSPGAGADREEEPEEPRSRSRRIKGARAPRSSREVTPETIGRAGLADETDESDPPPPDLDPKAAAAAIKARANRLRRHNALVRRLARRLSENPDGRLFEDPFDVLMLYPRRALLIEVKTVDGSAEDERDRVRDALAQLLYYEGFVTGPVAGATPVRKIACFEHKISDAHIAWLNRQQIAAIWEVDESEFAGDDLAGEFLGRYLEELE